MKLFRITLARYAGALVASGNPARWNSKDVKVIYTSSSRSLACLENVVHRNSRGLNDLFRVMTIEVPADVKIAVVNLKSLPAGWQEFGNIPATQKTGDDWVRSRK